MLKKVFRNQPYWQNAIKHALFPLLFYFLGFCLLTYPLILKFSTHFFSDAGDGLQNVWNLWWVNSVVLRPNLYPSIWQTDLLHWPFGTTLVGQTLNPFNGYVAVFLLRFLSLTTAHNTIVVFSFVLGGMTLYWLAYYLTRSFWGSLLAGFIFTFSNFHFMHAQGHLQLVSLEWIPLFILCWVVLITKPGPLIAVCAAIVLWMVLLCDNYYFLYCILTTILIVIWYAFVSKDYLFIIRKRHLSSLATFVGITFLLAGPIVSSLMITNYRDPLIGSHDPVAYSMDLLALFIPGGHWFFYQWTRFYWSKLPGNINESSVYLGLSVYVLLGYVWIKRKTLDLVTKQQVYLWFIMAGFFFVLALGPALHIAGKVIWDKAMPYTLLVNLLPFLKLSGVPERMAVMIALGASVLSALGFREFFRKIPRKLVLPSILLVILIFETLPRPLPATRVEVPEYVTTLAGLPRDGGVLDLVTDNQGLALYYQTINRQPIVFGYVSRLPASVYQAEGNLKKTIEDQDYAKLWDTYHIRYIITRDIIQAQSVLPDMFIETVFDKNDIRIYRIGCKCEVKQ